MGVLVAKKYPTVLFARAADHTYVECGTGGKGWKCWGGKTGGTAFNQGTGSTKRADLIAERDEKANIRCYLVNGVCHQSANRILLPARIIVSGARGYWISESLYGTYGWEGFWPCRSEFRRHLGVTGDLPECIPPGDLADIPAEGDGHEAESEFIRVVLELYEANAHLFGVEEYPLEAKSEFHMAHFSQLLDYRLDGIGQGLKSQLIDVRYGIDQRQLTLQSGFSSEDISGRDFVREVNELTTDFQTEMADRMTDSEYETLFELKKEEVIVLADPDIVSEVFGS